MYFSKEATASKGFADAIYIPVKNDRPALIVELKRNQTKESALDQIRNEMLNEKAVWVKVDTALYSRCIICN